MPIPSNTRILLAKLESTYGTDPTPTGSANAILATEIDFKPMEGADVSRELERPDFGADPTIPAELHGAITFKVELVPSGTAGTAPAWGPLLRACGVAETIVASTSVTYNPVTTGHESVTMHFYMGDTLYKMYGARGTAKLNVPAQGIPRLEFSFMGLYTTPAEGTRPTPDLSGFVDPQLVSSTNTPTFTIGGTSLVMRQAMLDLACQVETRFLVGSERVLITGRSEVFETTVEAVPLTTFDPFTLAAAQSKPAISLVHGVGAGKIATLAMPGAQMQRPQGLQAAQNIKEWPLRLVPQRVTGNDQWTLALT